LASCRDGKLFAAGENAAGKYEIAQTVTTAVGAKTVDIDTTTHKAYVPTFEFEEQQPGATGHPKTPGTFMIVVVAKH
jgi:hypothetical protein